jgi:hypothetical protein
MPGHYTHDHPYLVSLLTGMGPQVEAVRLQGLYSSMLVSSFFMSLWDSHQSQAPPSCRTCQQESMTEPGQPWPGS